MEDGARRRIDEGEAQTGVHREAGPSVNGGRAGRGQADPGEEGDHHSSRSEAVMIAVRWRSEPQQPRV